MTVQRSPDTPVHPVLSISINGSIMVPQTPPEGFELPVLAEVGGLLGLQLTGQSGPPVRVEIGMGGAWRAVSYPHTCVAGEVLRLTRTDGSAELGVIEVGSQGGAALPDGEGFAERHHGTVQMTPLLRDGVSGEPIITRFGLDVPVVET